MSYSQSSLSIKDAGGTSRLTNAYTDGTQFNFVHGLLDGTGALITTSNGLPSNLVQVGGSSFALGQQLAAASLPVVLTAIQVAALTPAALGSAVSASSNPVVIASDQGMVPIGNNFTFATATVTRPNDANIYAAGDLIATSTTAGSITCPTISVARANNKGGFISQVQITTNANTTLHALFRVHFYNVLPTFSNGDNGAWLTPSAGYIGYADVTMTQVFSDPAAAGQGIFNTGTGLAFIPVSGAQTLYWVLEARDIYTPTNNEVFTLNAWVN